MYLFLRFNSSFQLLSSTWVCHNFHFLASFFIDLGWRYRCTFLSYLEKKSSQVSRIIRITSEIKLTFTDQFYVLDLESCDARGFDHDPFYCSVPGWQLLENRNDLFYHSDFNWVQHDIVPNSPNASFDNSLCWRIPNVLLHLFVLFQKSNEYISFDLGWLPLYLSHYSDFMGTSSRLEVNEFLFRYIKRKFFPSDYEKVMQNVKRNFISKRILKSSMEEV